MEIPKLHGGRGRGCLVQKDTKGGRDYQEYLLKLVDEFLFYVTVIYLVRIAVVLISWTLGG